MKLKIKYLNFLINNFICHYFQIILAFMIFIMNSKIDLNIKILRFNFLKFLNFNLIGFIVNKNKPEKILICIDGVAPIAKIIQQRKRRYLSKLSFK